ncbi:MAG TPA: DUF3299 domain-containing protein [bacterium]
MRIDLRKGLLYGTAFGALLLLSNGRIFGQNFRKYSAPATSSTFAEGSGLANDALVQTASQAKDPLVRVKPEDLEGKSLVDFSRLASFNYDYPEYDDGTGLMKGKKKKKPGIPESILKLNGTQVAIPGFMIPMDQDGEGDKCSYFVLVRNQMSCCFGVAPGLNEWVSVRMEKGRDVTLEMDRPVVVVGTLEVGEIFNPDSGWSFYRMKGLKMVVAGKKKTWF